MPILFVTSTKIRKHLPLVGVGVDTHTQTLSIRIYLWFYGQKARKLVIKKSSKRGPVFVAVALWRGVVVAVGSRVRKAARFHAKVYVWLNGYAFLLFRGIRTRGDIFRTRRGFTGANFRASEKKTRNSGFFLPLC